MIKLRPESSNDKNLLERGQAIIEYALIAVLVGIAFGLAMAASAPVTGNLFNAVVNDLLRQTVVGDVPNPDQFWGTVTGVFLYTPTGAALPTNTNAPSTLEPTDGPSPTPTLTYTPSPTQPTSTPTLTRTPGDILKDAPFLDTVDEPKWWRIDSNFALSGHPWNGQFWPTTNFTGTETVVNGIWELKYNGPFITDYPTAATVGTNFSARFTRTIELPEARVVNFRAVADDGLEMTVDNVSLTLTNSSGANASLNGNNLDLYTGSASLAAGEHTIVVNYRQTTGNPVLRVEIVGGGANPDDTAVDGSGNPATGDYSCNWGVLTDEFTANTESNLFDDYVGGLNRGGTECYLEWRGAVVIPADALDMQLHFWDVWEFDNPNIDGWLEIAEYIPVDAVAIPPTANRPIMNWQKIDLGRKYTANFNWTHNVVDLEARMTGWGSRKMAFRFVMQIPPGVAASVGRQWYIDDIEFKRKTEKVFTVDRLWTLNNADERFDFIRTGGMSNPGVKSGWHLVSNNKFGPNGLAFHDSSNDAIDDPTDFAGTAGGAYSYYRRMETSPNSNFETDVRVHALEFDGWIDLTTVPDPDSFGNTGGPVLSFQHAYDLGGRVGLAVQYSTTPYNTAPATWITFPTGGTLRPITETTVSQALTMQEQVISLAGLSGNPQRIRIRFAMLVHKQSGVADGWWIDHIRLGRAESDKWLNYPFDDDVQDQGPLYYWRFNGAWAATTTRGHFRPQAAAGDVEMSYASSPRANYANNQVSHMTMRWPIDLYNDTPNKTVILEAGGAVATTNSYGAPATSDAILTFFHVRELASTDHFSVQWKRASEPDASYRTLWVYRYSMNTSSTGANNKTAINKAWQYTRVSLYPIFKQFAADGNGAAGVGSGAQLADDDVVLRFVLTADGSNNNAGVFVDDIYVEESSMRTVRLWPAGENRVDLTQPVSSPLHQLGMGTGSYFFSEPDGSSDGRSYRTDWKMGGTWSAQNFEKRKGSGLFAFHDSVLGDQASAPSGYRMTSGSDDFGDAAWGTPHETFSVLDLNREFDLRAVVNETEAPQLSFWTRYHLGRDDFAQVQISVWDPRAASTVPATIAALDSSMSSRCASQPVLQCYEQERGWGEWTNAWSAGSTSGATLSYGWRKISVDLRPYAYSTATGTAGKKIRIRFVYDAYIRDSQTDGWYLDGIEVNHRLPMSMTNVATTIYDDRAVSTANWITEGLWGLDENITLDGASTPINLGNWDGNWWHCPASSPDLQWDCEQLGRNAGASTNDRFKVGADIFLNSPTRPGPQRFGTYAPINLNFGGGSPVAGWTPNNEIVAEFTVDITVDGITFQPGKRSFSTRSDDGVRLKIEELNSATGNPIPNSPFEWNIINNWTDHAAVTDQGITPEALGFLLGRRYRLTLQYYEKSGDGVIQLAASAGSYSYSDSPKVTGGGTPDVPPIPRANTSLLGRHIFNLNGFDANSIPVLEIQTKYRIRNGTTANVEISTDGGFTWAQTGMSDNAFGVDYFPPSWGNATTSNFDAAPDDSPWEVRLFNLNSFENRHALVRMRYDRLGTSCYRNSGCDDSAAISNPSLALKDGYYDGWWIAVIRMGRTGN